MKKKAKKVTAKALTETAVKVYGWNNINWSGLVANKVSDKLHAQYDAVVTEYAEVLRIRYLKERIAEIERLLAEYKK